MSQLKFLVVDETSFMRNEIRKTLGSHFAPCETFDAPDVKHAQVILNTQKIDVILSEGELPDMTGDAFLHWIREHNEFNKMPFIIVSSLGDREHVLTAIHSGVSEYITKPFTPDELINKTTSVLQKCGLIKKQQKAQNSLDILMGGGGGDKAKKVVKPTVVAAAGPFASRAAPPAKKPEAASGQAGSGSISPKTKIQLPIRFGELKSKCIIKESSLTKMVVTMLREDGIPPLFAEALFNVAPPENDKPVIIKGHVFNLKAAEENVNSAAFYVTITLSDNDPAKLEYLSKLISHK